MSTHNMFSWRNKKKHQYFSVDKGASSRAMSNLNLRVFKLSWESKVNQESILLACVWLLT